MSSVRKFRVVVFSRDGRLRAILYDDSFRNLGEWWIESSNHKRYRPLKSAPPLVKMVCNLLDSSTLKKLSEFLLSAKEGEFFEFEAEVPSDVDRFLPPLIRVEDFEISTHLRLSDEELKLLLSALKKIAERARRTSMSPTLKIIYHEYLERPRVEIEVL
ncbi:MAG: hypothetical protein ACTSXX_13095 [Candidatus Baldrarchaeia archaeon]